MVDAMKEKRMKSMKARRILCTFLVLFVCVAAMAATANADTLYGDWEYRTSNGDIVITGYVGSAAKLVVPAQINGKNVVKIDDSAFDDAYYLNEITFPSTVKTIGSNALSDCTNLRTVNLPSTVQKIDGYAFEDCTSLTSITLPEALENLGSNAFKNLIAVIDQIGLGCGNLCNLGADGEGLLSICKIIVAVIIYDLDGCCTDINVVGVFNIVCRCFIVDCVIKGQIQCGLDLAAGVFHCRNIGDGDGDESGSDVCLTADDIRLVITYIIEAIVAVRHGDRTGNRLFCTDIGISKLDIHCVVDGIAFNHVVKGNFSVSIGCAIVGLGLHFNTRDADVLRRDRTVNGQLIDFQIIITGDLQASHQ